MTEHHPLIRDFPELKDRIHTLKSQPHFSKLAQAYEDLDKKITRAENRVENYSDSELEALKLERVKLKDDLYRLLTA
jgi:uncharacterized protein YdcH (DUF465 family)